MTSAAALGILLCQSSQAFGYAAYNAWGNYNLGDYSSSDSDDSYVHYQSNVAGDYFVTALALFPVLSSADNHSLAPRPVHVGLRR